MAAPRPRFSKLRTYNPKKYTEYKEAVSLLAKKQCKNHFNGAIRLEITFYMQIPESWSKKKQRETIGKYHISKPDTDNMIKTIKDSLEGVFFKNDSQICEIDAKKIYSENPRTEFTLINL